MNLINLLLFFVLLFSHLEGRVYDLTIMGNMCYREGLGRISIGLIDHLKGHVHINFIPVYNLELTSEISEEIQEIALNQDKKAGKVLILTFPPDWESIQEIEKKLPNSKIKIAYSMTESTRINQNWVEFFNNHFDAIVVPDSCFIKYYCDSGIKIPIFSVPLGMYLNHFLNQPNPKSSHSPFVFGMSGGGLTRKNILLAIQAFIEEFGNSEDVKLIIHDRYDQKLFEIIKEKVNVSNVFVYTDILNQKKYIEMMKSFDCYINISKGEGFSCCPREFLALGIPCILSDNTAHSTLCQTSFVRSVSSLIPVVPDYGTLLFPVINHQLGHQFNCELGDVRQALRDVYDHYEYYLKKAKSGRKWVRKYSWKNLKPKYLNLVKPKLVLLGNENIVTKDYLMTNSFQLYMKYMDLE